MEALQNIDLIKTLAMVVALVIAIVGHEIMHGFVAYKFGDETAKNQGRLSPNPIKHVDPVGTIIVPGLLYLTNAGFLFGWAKPVPVYMPTVVGNGGFFGAIAVALAGIAYNFSLAIVGAILFHVIPFTEQDFIFWFIVYMVQINVVLGIFNLYPLPPLDGFNALGYALAWMGFKDLSRQLFSYSRYGMVVLLLVIAVPQISHYFFQPMYYVIRLLLS